VNVKKGQWMAPREMAGAVAKLRGGGAAGVAVTERGTFFGYGNLVVDMRAFTELRTACEAPAIFDGTHSVQRPGEGAGVSGGEPHFIPPLVRAAVAAGADGLFLETHPHPASAPSDATNMLPLAQLERLLEEVLAIRAAVPPAHSIIG
jgi:2-dehydro-3-deoxyphosphooctonate aldolase (KDO 8-P synthase)